MHRTGDLYGHFQTLEQQKETATLGMWIFLVTEVLFFGGMFLAYTINRSAFSMNSNGSALRLTSSSPAIARPASARST